MRKNDVGFLKNKLRYKADSFFNKETCKYIESYYHSQERGSLPIPMHSHGFFEINIITNGTGFHYFDKKKLKVKVGDVFFIPSGKRHGYNEINDLEIFHILISDEFFDRFSVDFEKVGAYFELFKCGTKNEETSTYKGMFELNKTQFKYILSLLDELACYESDDVCCNLSKMALVIQIICVMCQYYEESLSDTDNKNKSKQYSSSVVRIIGFIEKNFSQKISIDYICRKFYISKSTFLRNFKKIVGQTPYSYISELRLKKSKYLLKETNKSITTIAVECGYFDASHFERNFLKKEKISPSQFRYDYLHRNDKKKEEV